MTINQQYNFFITFPITGEEQFYPANNSLKWRRGRYKDQFFFRETLETTLNICDKDLFERIWQLEKSKCDCESLEIRIEERCSLNDPFETVYYGVFSFVDGNWCPDECKVSFKPRTNDVYKCMLDSWDEEKNFLDIVARQDIKTLCGPIESEYCTAIVSKDLLDFTLPDPPTGCLDNPNTWSLYYFRWTSNTTPGGTVYNVQALWVRQYIDQVDQPDCGCLEWIEASPGHWVAPAPTTSNLGNSGNIATTGPNVGSSSNAYEETYQLIAVSNVVIQLSTQGTPIGLTAEPATIDNGITLQDFINFYLEDCFDCVVSNFLNINPDNTTFTNYEYECAKKELHEVILFQSSDIINPNGVNASSGNINQIAGLKDFESFWTAFSKLLRLNMWFDKKINCLRIEHESYPQERGRILSLYDFYKKCLSGKGKFQHLKERRPLSETLEYSQESPNKEFQSGVIRYKPDCSGDGENKKAKDSIDCFSNDIAHIYNNQDLQEDRNDLDNITLVSTSNGIVNYSNGVITGQSIINGPFAMANIIRKYHLRNKHQCFITVNGEENVQSLSQIKTRKQDTITVDQFKCKFFRQLDEQIDQVRTQFAETCIESVEYDAPSGKAVFELIF